MWPQNQTIICTNEYICLEILGYSNILEYFVCENCKSSTNECWNIFVALNKYYEYFLQMNIFVKTNKKK